MGYLMGDGHSAVGCYSQNIEISVVARYVTPRFEVGMALIKKPGINGHGTPSDRGHAVGSINLSAVSLFAFG